LPKLEELYLSHNGISELKGLGHCPGLKILDVGNNRIKVLEGLDSLESLEELWVINIWYIIERRVIIYSRVLIKLRRSWVERLD
jgi:hypothetical protein